MHAIVKRNSLSVKFSRFALQLITNINTFQLVFFQATLHYLFILISVVHIPVYLAAGKDIFLTRQNHINIHGERTNNFSD